MIKKILISALITMCSLVQAQEAIRLVVPFAAGGPTDALARSIQTVISETLGRVVVMDYKPGAGGEIAAASVANTEPNKTSLLLYTTLALSTTRYDESKLLPQMTVGSIPFVLVVSANGKFKNLSDWKQINRPIFYGSSGVGTIGHLNGATFAAQTQQNMIHVPYPGQSKSIVDLLNGTIDFAFLGANTIMPFVESNQLVPLATNSANRLQNFPAVPTLRELSITNIDLTSVNILMSNSTASKSDLEKINQALINSKKNPRYRELFQAAGLDTINMSTPTLDFLEAEKSRYKSLIGNLKN